MLHIEQLMEMSEMLMDGELEIQKGGRVAGDMIQKK